MVLESLLSILRAHCDIHHLVYIPWSLLSHHYFFTEIGKTDEILNCFTFIPSVTNMNLSHALVTVNRRSHLFHLSRNTLNMSLGRGRPFQSVYKLDCNPRWMLFSGLIDSEDAFGRQIPSFCFYDVEYFLKYIMVPFTFADLDVSITCSEL